MATTTANVPVIDRRLRDLEAPARNLLALINLSRQPCWRVGGLLELLSAFPQTQDGMPVIFHLFEAGLLYPELNEKDPQLSSFEDWLGRGGTDYRVFAPSTVTERAADLPVELEPLTEIVTHAKEVREADGLEFPIRLGALWQQVKAAPLRLTQQGAFFKKDHERLTADPLLAEGPADALGAMHDPGHFLVACALVLDLVRLEAGEILPAKSPELLSGDLVSLLTRLWSAHPWLDFWDAGAGWSGLQAQGRPFGAAAVLALALLRQLPEAGWAAPEAVARWLLAHHCWWKARATNDDFDEELATPAALTTWTSGFLLTIAYQLRLVRAGRDSKGRWVVQLSAFGRGILLCGPAPEPQHFPKTLMVQPNLEMIAYRQGLTPELIGNLSRFCTWKNVGPACTLQLQPESVYRGLETGLTHDQILRTLQQHSVRDLPPTVLQSLQTWADKRERVTVYAAATLLEFASTEELDAALGRGLPATRLSERLALVAHENDIDYRHFRMAGARDYGLPPDQCVALADDGVTLSIDLARADLLLETEVQRFAEVEPSASMNGRRVYRLTPASLKRGREGGVSSRSLEDWFQQRTGMPLPPAARLLLDAAGLPAPVVQRLLVMQAATPLVADGLMQWPATRRLIQTRLGPTALAVAEANLPALTALLSEIDIRLEQALS